MRWRKAYRQVVTQGRLSVLQFYSPYYQSLQHLANSAKSEGMLSDQASLQNYHRRSHGVLSALSKICLIVSVYRFRGYLRASHSELISMIFIKLVLLRELYSLNPLMRKSLLGSTWNGLGLLSRLCWAVPFLLLRSIHWSKVNKKFTVTYIIRLVAEILSWALLAATVLNYRNPRFALNSCVFTEHYLLLR